MIDISFYFFLSLAIFFISVISKKKRILLNSTGLDHQNFFKKSGTVPLLGGVFLLIFLIFFFKDKNTILCLFFFIIFIIGLFSDTRYEPKPKIRFFLQFIVIIIFIYFLDLSIKDIRINLINKILSYQFASILFTAFCSLVLLNGSNFIDGNNTLLIGYYLLISLTLYFFNLDLIDINLRSFFLNFIIFLVILYIFNFFEFFYMGDSGAYLLSAFFSFFLIKIYNYNGLISPYYIFNLLWYPAFENLFSILRKLFQKKSPLSADNEHLHQLLFRYLVNKILIKKKFINSLTGNIINFYNFLMFIILSNFIYDTKFQILAVFLNVSIYLLVYYFLKIKGRIVQR